MPTPTTLPDWVHMLDAHAAQGIPSKSRTPEAVAARQAEFDDDYHATQNLDYAIRHGRRAGEPISRFAEARRVLSRAADLNFPTHRKESRHA